MPNALASRAVSVPMAPTPTSSSVWPRSSPTGVWPSGQWRSCCQRRRCGRSLANASSPRIANSASGPAWTPEEVVTVILSSSPGSASASAAAELLAGAGVAGLHPLEPRRAADEVDQVLARAPGDPEHDLGALDRVLPALVVERHAALAVDVADSTSRVGSSSGR